MGMQSAPSYGGKSSQESPQARTPAEEELWYYLDAQWRGSTLEPAANFIPIMCSNMQVLGEVSMCYPLPHAGRSDIFLRERGSGQ